MNVFEDEMEHHIDRWTYPESMMEWYTDIEEEIHEFVLNRPCVSSQNVINYFKSSYKTDNTLLIDDQLL